MNDYPVRRIAATLTIGSFSIAALMGIVALLSGGDFSTGEERVLLTTVIVGSASICMLCYLATSGTRFVVAGVAGAITLVLPVSTALVLVWVDFNEGPEGLIKAFGIGVVLALSLAQVCLLLGLAGDRRGLRVVLAATVALATALAALICSLILGTLDIDDLWRLLGVIAILDVLGTLVTIAVAKFGGKDDGGAAGVRRFVLPQPQADAIDELARSTGRSPAELVSEAVEKYLKG